MSNNTTSQSSTPSSNPAAEFMASVDSDCAAFERQQAETLGLDIERPSHWADANPHRFSESDKSNTTILHAGLTMAHDLFIQSAFRGLGYKVEAMEVPDTEALQFGREFGNRGQCNPTYFTVGNLVKKLKQLEASGLTKREIVDGYIFATFGSCGPCRFGTYVTEYRKALRDSGFEGFRVLLIQQAGGVKQATGENLGLKVNLAFVFNILKAIVIGDVVNALGYRIRPYEKIAGSTDAVIAEVKKRIALALEARRGLKRALLFARCAFDGIDVDRSQIKPKVAIIGEFWAMTTEGDGNYKMQRFLEQEGAEVDVQLTVAWPLYMLWCARDDVKQREQLQGVDVGQVHGGSKFALEGVNVMKRRLILASADRMLRGLFRYYAALAGLRDYKLPNMDEIAALSHRYYNTNLRGGEGHMEVGKLIQNVIHQKATMTLSIKPFGCMPSSAVSDGVQSLITELHPSAIFLPIETNGDGAVNVYSRVQMQLFKARQAAEKEVDAVLSQAGLSLESFRNILASRGKLNKGLHRSPHRAACTAADLAYEIA